MAVMLWSVSSITLTIAGVGLMFTRYLRQYLTTVVANDLRAATRTDGGAAVRSIKCRKCTSCVLPLAHMVRCRSTRPRASKFLTNSAVCAADLAGTISAASIRDVRTFVLCASRYRLVAALLVYSAVAKPCASDGRCSCKSVFDRNRQSCRATAKWTNVFAITDGCRLSD